MRSSRSEIVGLLMLGALTVAAFLLSLFLGGTESVLSDDTGHYILREIRFPKTLTAVVAGGSLAVCGLVLQILFRNPLAGPYVLGISSGASLLVAVTMLFWGGVVGGWAGRGVTLTAAVAGSVLVTVLILVVARRVSSNVILLLTGLMISMVCNAVEASLAYLADPAHLKTFVVWNMGSLAGTSLTDLWVFVPLIATLLFAMMFFMKPLNALLLGTDYAQSAGIDVRRSRFWLIVICSGLTGITTAFCGPIAFAGIATPILSRMIFSTSRQQTHFISCILLGSCMLLLADAAGHWLSPGTAIPVNILTTFFGAPLVVWMMFRTKTW